MRVQFGFQIVSTWNEDIKISSPVFLMEPDKNSPKDLLNLQKFDAYILLLDTIQQWKKWLSGVFHHIQWNPAAKFIATFKEEVNLTKVFKSAWRRNLVNFNLYYDNKIFTYFPYNSSNCVINYDPVEIHTCGNEIQDMFPNKIPRTLNGCKINLVANTIPPYVINVSADRNNAREAGYEPTLIHTISKKFNLTNNYINHNFQDFGIRLPNGSYTEMYNYLIDKSADILLGKAVVQLDHVELETMAVHINEEILWWVPIAEQAPIWKNFIKIYKPFMWLLIIFVIILKSVIWWIISKVTRKYNSKKRNEFNFINSVLISICTFLQLTVRPPSSASLRSLFIFWVAFTLILATAYQSQLTSILTRPTYEYQISSIEDLVRSKLKFGFYHNAAKFYSNPNSSIETYITKNFITCPLTEECLNRTAFDRDFAVIKNKRQAYFMIKKYYSYPDGRPMIYGFENGMTGKPRIVVKRGFPLLKLFNSLIIRLRENGILYYWDQEFSHTRKVQWKPVPTSLTISHLKYGFILLVVGLCFSILVFLREVFWAKLHKLTLG